MTASFHLCLGPASVNGKPACRCCGEVGRGSFMSDEFAPGGCCWPCAFGDNPHCERCVELGVPFHRFRGKPSKTKMHRLVGVVAAGDDWKSACGLLTLPSNQVGMATAIVTTYCQKCWPDEVVGDPVEPAATPTASAEAATVPDLGRAGVAVPHRHTSAPNETSPTC